MEIFSSKPTLIGRSLVNLAANRKLAYKKRAAKRPLPNPKNSFVPIMVVNILVNPTSPNQSQSVYNLTSKGSANTNPIKIT